MVRLILPTLIIVLVHSANNDICGQRPDDCAALICTCMQNPDGIDYGCCGQCYEQADGTCDGIKVDQYDYTCGGIAGLTCATGYECIYDTSVCDPTKPCEQGNYYLLQYINDSMKPSFNNKIKCTSTQSILGEQMPPTLHSRFILMGHHQTDHSLQMTHDLLSLWKQDNLYSMGIAFGSVMIYGITANDMVKIYFVEYINNRDFNIDYIYKIRHSEYIGDIEPKTLIFMTDNDINNGIACLFVAYAIRILSWMLSEMSSSEMLLDLQEYNSSVDNWGIGCFLLDNIKIIDY